VHKTEGISAQTPSKFEYKSVKGYSFYQLNQLVVILDVLGTFSKSALQKRKVKLISFFFFAGYSTDEARLCKEREIPQEYPVP
jgi:hypothetical protein